MDWQPIETAPEDGVEVLFFHPEQGMAVWPARAGWPGVTHWMPLPPEPSVTLPAGRAGDAKEKERR